MLKIKLLKDSPWNSKEAFNWRQFLTWFSNNLIHNIFGTFKNYISKLYRVIQKPLVYNFFQNRRLEEKYHNLKITSFQ